MSNQETEKSFLGDFSDTTTPGVGDGSPTPKEILIQGNATIKRVREFFAGVDISRSGSFKNGPVRVYVRAGRDGYRFARAIVNGLEAATMNVKFDPKSGKELRGDSFYTLSGVFDALSMKTCNTYVRRNPDSMRTITTLYINDYEPSKSATHGVGDLDYPASPTTLDRLTEKAILRSLGVTF